ncbi:MAG: TonB-dependent receptor [Proteobacteria bacterium]|nr:TonB-dependent receptor [Pseudomonadota bacterium]HQR02765.1 TonB-dependent receptor [Rhodocyclaceae bacterium]
MHRAICSVLVATTGLAMSATWATEVALEEVIVTAQKRSENLQEIPISVTSFDSSALEKAGIQTLADIGAMVPGLQMKPYPGSSETFQPSIRGIVPNAVGVLIPNPLAVHYNGVYLSQSAGLNFAAGDIERIEVLKGPQGVLAGRNSTGGTLNIYTVKPDLGEFGFKQQITLAQRGQLLSKTSVNLPLRDDLAVRLTYFHSDKDNDGISNSASGGFKFGEKTTEAYRLDVRWKPAATVTVDYGYDHSLTEGYDTPPQCLVPGNQMVFANFTGGLTAAPFMGDPRVQQYVAGCSMSRLSSLYYPFQLPKNRNLAEGHTLNVSWEVSPTLTIRSITGFRKTDTANTNLYTAYGSTNTLGVRSDGGPLSLVAFGTGAVVAASGTQGPAWTLYNEALSEEVQFIGDVNENFKYTAGLYFSEEKGHDRNHYVATYVPTASLFGGVDLVAMGDAGISSARSRSIAVFGQFSWRPDVLGRKLEIVPGVRYTRDHKQAVGFNMGWGNIYQVLPSVNPAVPGVATVVGAVPTGYMPFSGVSGDRTFSQTTPSLSFNYHWSDTLMGYAKVTKGFTSGGFDPVSGPPNPVSFAQGFAPETVTSMEVGFKGEFLERRLRVNGAAFETKFSNEQKTTYAGGGWAVQNIGASTYNGFELDVTAAVTERLRLGFSASWLSHRYGLWRNTDPTVAPVGANIASLMKMFVPKQNWSMTMDYRFPDFGLPGKLDLNLGATHQDAFSSPVRINAPTLPDYSTTPGYTVMNGRLALSRLQVGPGNKGDLTVALWVHNLTDKKYATYRTINTSADSASPWGEPRTVGLDLIYQY